MASALNIAIGVPQPDLPRPGGGGTPPDFDYGRGPPRGGGPSSGSGFAIDRRHVLTNAHVVDGGGKFTAQGDRMTLPADLVFSDPHNDIAMLRVSEDLEAVAQFRESLDIHLGEDIIVLGFPLQGLLGSGPQVTSGNVSALCGMGNDTGVLQFTAPISSGNSGGRSSTLLDSSSASSTARSTPIASGRAAASPRMSISARKAFACGRFWRHRGPRP